jgi:hypothetical protein
MMLYRNHIPYGGIHVLNSEQLNPPNWKEDDDNQGSDDQQRTAAARPS